ncbi:MAG: SRPBCC family protein [Solirubrobacteraceae bacterium]
MRVQELRDEQTLARPIDEVFAFFARASNLALLMPPELGFRLAASEPIELRAGALLEYRLRVHGIPLRWVARIEEWEPNRTFVDRQLRGPYRLWLHRHSFDPVADGTLVREHVRYALPFGRLGDLALPLVRRDLRRLFEFRAAELSRLLG